MTPASMRELVQAIERELVYWPGATWDWETSGKHARLILTFDGRSRFVVCPSTPSDGWRGHLNKISDIRATLVGLGAAREARTKSSKPRRRAPVAQPKPERLTRSEPITGGPERDPWAPLRERFQ